MAVLVVTLAADGRTVVEGYLAPDPSKATAWHEAAVERRKAPFVISSNVFRMTDVAVANPSPDSKEDSGV